MRAFARDYETRPPLQWEKPRPDDDSEVQRRMSTGDDDSTVLSRLSLDSLPSSQGEPSHATTQSRASLTQRPACSPIPEKRKQRRQRLPPVVNWGCPVDTSSSALLSRPLRRKNARLTLPRPPLNKTTAQSAGPAKDAADAMERLGPGHERAADGLINRKARGRALPDDGRLRSRENCRWSEVSRVGTTSG